jgi:uncharacterized protein YdiU (UPF0061 family)
MFSIILILLSIEISTSKPFLRKSNMINKLIKKSMHHPLKSHTTSLTSVITTNLESFCKSSDNSFTSCLVAEATFEEVQNNRQELQLCPREVKNSHFSYVLPEPVKDPFLIAISKSCSVDIGLDPEEAKRKEFIELFSGNKLLPGFDQPWASVYGCHVFGQWFGQLGDGRAMSIGEVVVVVPQRCDENHDISNCILLIHIIYQC